MKYYVEKSLFHGHSKKASFFISSAEKTESIQEFKMKLFE